MKTYYALGLMSGDSLDGLNLVYCRLDWNNNSVQKWKIIQADTFAFSPMWKARLQALPLQNAFNFAKTDVYFGYYMAELVRTFVQKYKIEKLDFIASHGHTVFHNPARGFSTQIGSGATLAAMTKQKVICDFRTQDVALGGEGAPFTALADHYLYPQHDYYIHLGGILSISTCRNEKWTAFDVCYANQVLNLLATELELSCDEGGKVARAGQLNKVLLEQLKKVPFYKKRPPKSMSNEWIRRVIFPIYTNVDCSIEDKLNTAVEHIAHELMNAMYRLNQNKTNTLFVTGGGVHNTYLVERLSHFSRLMDKKIVLPDPVHIDYKKAILVALLGVLRLENVPNSFATATGASYSTINGAIHIGKLA